MALILRPYGLLLDRGVATEVLGRSIGSSLRSHTVLSARNHHRSAMKAAWERRVVAIRFPYKRQRHRLRSYRAISAPTELSQRCWRPYGAGMAILPRLFCALIRTCSKCAPRHGALGDPTTSMEIAWPCCSVTTAMLEFGIFHGGPGIAAKTASWSDRGLRMKVRTNQTRAVHVHPFMNDYYSIQKAP